MATVTRRAPKPKQPRRSPLPRQPTNAKAGKLIYYFGKTRTDGSGNQKPLLGGKGANLAEMTRIGLPVPPGFTITTEVCDLYYKSGRKLPAGPDGRARQGTSPCSKKSWARNSATTPTRCSFRSAAARASRCRA